MYEYDNYIENYRMKDLLKKLTENEMCLSLNHQSKFFTVKDKVIAWVKSQSKEEDLLYGPPGRQHFAIVVNGTNSAFRHIFKSGGTTVNRLTKNKHIKNKELGGRKLFTAVRDPIDHFLSGWAECGFRSENPDKDPAFRMDLDFDERVQNWLTCVKGDTKRGAGMRKHCKDAIHSYPQSNFLLDIDVPHSIDTKLELVGDLAELRKLMGVVGFRVGEDDMTRAQATGPRDSSQSKEKVERYPRNKALLSDFTLRQICEFVILDYYLFDFTPPDACLEQIESDMLKIQNLLSNA